MFVFCYFSLENTRAPADYFFSISPLSVPRLDVNTPEASLSHAGSKRKTTGDNEQSAGKNKKKKEKKNDTSRQRPTRVILSQAATPPQQKKKTAAPTRSPQKNDDQVKNSETGKPELVSAPPALSMSFNGNNCDGKRKSMNEGEGAASGNLWKGMKRHRNASRKKNLPDFLKPVDDMVVKKWENWNELRILAIKKKRDQKSNRQGLPFKTYDGKCIHNSKTCGKTYWCSPCQKSYRQRCQWLSVSCGKKGRGLCRRCKKNS